ncbi:hypothetical protein [Brevundimonas vancanneytii]|uniref:Uncharacterized protein n=1 Tax=Brevundimonas vancanneytii TaxID=1325724 RepID=A0A4P1KD80_9CAUL|nr:Uncharacterised protein [Brevundimonas vancanneytii]
MRRVLTALAALSLTAALIPHAAAAQSGRPQGGQQGGQKAEQAPSRPMRIAPLSRRANAGPCPYVKILYDAARFVELSNYEQPTTNGVGFTGEIEGVSSDCVYRESDPIRLDVNLLFSLGKGPQAEGDAPHLSLLDRRDRAELRRPGQGIFRPAGDLRRRRPHPGRGQPDHRHPARRRHHQRRQFRSSDRLRRPRRRWPSSTDPAAASARLRANRPTKT